MVADVWAELAGWAGIQDGGPGMEGVQEDGQVGEGGHGQGEVDPASCGPASCGEEGDPALPWAESFPSLATASYLHTGQE